MSDGDKKRIKACPRCGSLRIKVLSLREGGVPGASEMSGMYYCEKCKSRVTPIVFDDEEAYRRFIGKKKCKSL
jgi:hypothetical protein